MLDSRTRLLSGRSNDFARGVADHASLVVEGPFVGMAELLVDSFGPAEDLGDDFAGPRKEDAGGVDHGGQGLQLPELGVDRSERHRCGSPTRTVHAAGR